MQEIKTKFGTLYYRASHLGEDFLYVLLDSDKNFITNIYNRDTLYEIEKIEYLDDLFDVIGECGTYGYSIEDLTHELNEILGEEKRIYGTDFEPFTIEEVKDNDYTNHIGEYYIFFLK